MNPRAIPWTEAEDAALAEAYPNSTDAELLALIGRPWNQIERRITKLGLAQNDNGRKRRKTREVNRIRAEVIAAYGGAETARELAVRFGTTRNAIIGIWHRHREKHQPSMIRRRPRQPTVWPEYASAGVVQRQVIQADRGKAIFHESTRVSISLPRLKFMEDAS